MTETSKIYKVLCLLYVFVDGRLKLRLRHCTYYFIYYLTAFDKKDGRDAADTVFHRYLRV